MFCLCIEHPLDCLEVGLYPISHFPGPNDSIGTARACTRALEIHQHVHCHTGRLRRTDAHHLVGVLHDTRVQRRVTQPERIRIEGAPALGANGASHTAPPASDPTLSAVQCVVDKAPKIRLQLGPSCRTSSVTAIRTFPAWGVRPGKLRDEVGESSPSTLRLQSTPFVQINVVRQHQVVFHKRGVFVQLVVRHTKRIELGRIERV